MVHLLNIVAADDDETLKVSYTFPADYRTERQRRSN